jgi:hypothetical protein
MKVTTDVSPEAVQQNAQRMLYVEGKSGGLDPQVLRAVVEDLGWRVEGLGPSQDIRAVARAMHQSHPHYFFIIDRDHHSEAEVEQTWHDFPNTDKHNLLIWRRRELENYFLDAEFLGHSAYLRQDWDSARLAQRIVALVEARIYMDCANLVIAHVREDQKATWIKAFDKPNELATASAGRNALLALPQWQGRVAAVGTSVQTTELARRYDVLVGHALGGAERVETGRGQWLNLVAGKEVFHAIVNEACQVRPESGQVVQGAKARHLVARELLRRKVPDDFGDLKDLLRAVAGTGPTR